MEDQDLFSRERLAGYDPAVLHAARILLVGAGALGNNVALILALAGIGEIWIVDPDVLDVSNATRAPLVSRRVAQARTPRKKARLLAEAVLRRSYAENAAVRYAERKVEALGRGAIARADVVVSAVDSFGVRALLADVCRLLSVPLVEGGFRGTRGNVSVYSNDEPESACYRCLNGRRDDGLSCTLYAQEVLAEGRTPATQSIAGLTAAYVAEAVIRSLHPDGSPLAGKLITFDVGDGRGSRTTLTRDPECPGAHRSIGERRKSPVCVRDPAIHLFDAVPEFANPELILPAKYIVDAPCSCCGSSVIIGKPVWAVAASPTCRACGLVKDEGPSTINIVSEVRPGDSTAWRSCRELGLAPLDLVEVRDGATGRRVAVELTGTLDALLARKERKSLRARDSDETGKP